MSTATTDLAAATLAISGNIAREPELSYSAAGRPWCRFSVAVNQRTRTEDGTWQEGEPEFFSVVCFGQLAENAAESLHKGDRVVAKGRFEEEHWTAKDGTKRSGWKLVAEDVGASMAFATLTTHRAERRVPATTAYQPREGWGQDEEVF